jgi:hypothetical protein
LPALSNRAAIICDAPEPDTVSAGKDARAGLVERDRLNGHIVTRKKIPQRFSGARIPQARGAILGAGRMRWPSGENAAAINQEGGEIGAQPSALKSSKASSKAD